jgi:hypothetical protein
MGCGKLVDNLLISYVVGVDKSVENLWGTCGEVVERVLVYYTVGVRFSTMIFKSFSVP